MLCKRLKLTKMSNSDRPKNKMIKRSMTVRKYAFDYQKVYMLHSSSMYNANVMFATV